MNISSSAYPSKEIFLVHQKMILKCNTQILYTIVGGGFFNKKIKYYQAVLFLLLE